MYNETVSRRKKLVVNYWFFPLFFSTIFPNLIKGQPLYVHYKVYKKPHKNIYHCFLNNYKSIINNYNNIIENFFCLIEIMD